VDEASFKQDSSGFELIINSSIYLNSEIIRQFKSLWNQLFIYRYLQNATN